MDKQTRLQKWGEVAVQKELQAILNLPKGVRLQKPNNPYWQSLFRLAGVAKGCQLNPTTLLSEILQASQHLDFGERNITYQWQRAMKRAQPRVPKNL